MKKIFISYARQDQKFVDYFKPVFKRLDLEEKISFFQDIEDIKPGELFELEIEEAIKNSYVTICFLSMNFFASQYIQERELPLMLSMYNDRGLHIIPIQIVDMFIDSSSIFSKIQRLNKNLLCDLKTETEISISIKDCEIAIRNVFKRKTNYKRIPGNIRYNIVVIGKSGVGKSELTNYLFGSDIFKTGTGKPVTQLGFQSQDVMLGDIPTTIYDSAGIEIGNPDKWIETLQQALFNRKATESVSKWFHTVLYCVQAVGERIEPFEIKIINEFLQQDYNVIVVITKSYINDHKLLLLTNSIKNEFEHNIECVYVNSADEEFPTGVVKKFGKDLLIKEIQNSLIKSLTGRVPERAIGFMESYIDEQCTNIISYIESEVNVESEVNAGLNRNQKNWIAENVNTKLTDLVKNVKSPTGELPKIVRRETSLVLNTYKEISSSLANSGIFEKDIQLSANISILPHIEKIENFWSEMEKTLEEGFDWGDELIDKLEDVGVPKKIGKPITTGLKAIATIVNIPTVVAITGTKQINKHINWEYKLKTETKDFCSRLKNSLRDSKSEIKLEYVKLLLSAETQ